MNDFDDRSTEIIQFDKKLKENKLGLRDLKGDIKKSNIERV